MYFFIFYQEQWLRRWDRDRTPAPESNPLYSPRALAARAPLARERLPRGVGRSATLAVGPARVRFRSWALWACQSLSPLLLAWAAGPAAAGWIETDDPYRTWAVAAGPRAWLSDSNSCTWLPLKQERA